MKIALPASLAAVPFPVLAIAAGLVGLVLLRATGTAAAAGQALGGAAVDVAGGAVAGVATGVGDAIGVPRTDQTACQQALAEGRYWDASFACPAGTFIGGAYRAITD